MLPMNFYSCLEKYRAPEKRALFLELYLVSLSFGMHDFVPSKDAISCPEKESTLYRKRYKGGLGNLCSRDTQVNLTGHHLHDCLARAVVFPLKNL